MKKHFYYVVIFALTIFFPVHSSGQAIADTTTVSLKQCLSFALRNQPVTKQAVIDEEINEKNIGIALADWLPQINGSGNIQHNFQLPVTFFNGSVLPVGTPNTSTATAAVNQVIFNPTVALAARTARYSRQYYKQNYVSTEISTVSDVSKAFYDVLLSSKQVSIINADIVRLQRSQKDAYSRYQAGIVDKIDYKQATISLNNDIASRKQAQEAIKAKLAYLKQTMGFAPEKPLQLQYDSVQLERETLIDTAQMLSVDNRIEYQLLQTQKTLDNLNVGYYRTSFLPSISAFGEYNLDYYNNNFQNLYGTDYPNSYVGLSFTVPIFTGGKRLKNLSKARLQVERADLDIVNTANTINTEYAQALANYKSNYNDYKVLRENVDLARDVYRVVSIQYREGIKQYLDVITAQADVHTAELNYYNALFNLLSSKIDLQRSLGILPIQY